MHGLSEAACKLRDSWTVTGLPADACLAEGTDSTHSRHASHRNMLGQVHSCHASDITIRTDNTMHREHALTVSQTACTHHVTDSTHSPLHRQHALTMSQTSCTHHVTDSTHSPRHRQHALTMSQTSTSRTFLPANRASPDSTVEPDTAPLPWCHSALDRLWWRALAPPLPFEMWLLLSLPLSVPLLLPLEVEALRPTLPACT